MKIVVCIKQVPDTKGGVKFNPDGTLDRAAMLTIMNPDDKAGLEFALRLKEAHGAHVTVISMGPMQANKVLAEAVAMEVTTKAVQLHGGYGYIREYDVERMMRDAKITEIYEGTSEVQRMVISANILN